MHMFVLSRGPGLHSTCWVIGIFRQQKRLIFGLSLTCISTMFGFFHSVIGGQCAMMAFQNWLKDLQKEAYSNSIVELGLGWIHCYDT